MGIFELFASQYLVYNGLRLGWNIDPMEYTQIYIMSARWEKRVLEYFV